MPAAAASDRVRASSPTRQGRRTSGCRTVPPPTADAVDGGALALHVFVHGMLVEHHLCFVDHAVPVERGVTCGRWASISRFIAHASGWSRFRVRGLRADTSAGEGREQRDSIARKVPVECCNQLLRFSGVEVGHGARQHQPVAFMRSSTGSARSQ